MAKIINLGKARKLKNREAKGKFAAENRVKFGRKKVEKLFEKREHDDAEKHIADHKLDD